MTQSVCIQGLGFVGSAMAVACASAVDASGTPHFNVVGLDLPTPAGTARIDAINRGEFPFATSDASLAREAAAARARGNLSATSDPGVLATADVIVVDVPLDIDFTGPRPSLVIEPFKAAISTVGEFARDGALIVVETTVAPGTCERIVRPELEFWCERRGMSHCGLLLAHSYERVMPGEHYLESITNFWRAYAGINERAADACEAFLSKVIDVARFPLRRLPSTTASETAKVLENAYRATNIAFIDEWGRFAERAGVDLFQVIDAIRVRPTHDNIRQPGFGVGGYCLTKDPVFAEIAARDVLGIGDHNFPMSELAMSINRDMPLHALDLLAERVGTLNGRHIALAGISYRQDVADTRYSPSQAFVQEAERRGASVLCLDPLVSHWEELDRPVSGEFASCPDVEAVVFAVPHREFRAIEPGTWLAGRRPVVLDANDCLTAAQRDAFAAAGCSVASVGRGDAVSQ
jgi:nucleotide sugar dehydrogenase